MVALVLPYGFKAWGGNTPKSTREEFYNIEKNFKNLS
mgnify:CR=1 FL=1